MLIQLSLHCGEARLERDEQLYARLQEGDRAALAGLVERYHGLLLKFLIRMTGQTQSAEDLVQDTFIRILTYRGVPPVHFRAWIYQIARNLARDNFRSAAIRRETDHLPDDDQGIECLAAATDAENLILQTSNRQQVNALLQNLTANQREVIILRFYHELSLEDISQITRAPVGTVKSRLFHSLRRARQILEKEEVRRDEKSSG